MKESLSGPSPTSLYKKDLPEDLLDLIDYTTRGVKRLYESTLRASSVKDQARRRTYSRGAHSDCVTELDRLGHQYKGENMFPLAAVEANKKSGMNKNKGRLHSVGAKMHVNGLGGGSRCVDGAEKKKGVHRRSRDQAQVTTTSSINTDIDSTGTIINSTFSLDVQGQSAALQCAPVKKNPSAAPTAIGSSVTTRNEQSTAFAGRKWKDTFRSLLSGGAMIGYTSINTTASSGICHRNGERGSAFVGTHNSVKSGGREESSCAREDVLSMDCSVDDGYSRQIGKEERNDHSTLSEQNAAIVERCQRRMEEREALHKEEISQVRAEYNAEIIRIRREGLEARQKAMDDVTAQLTASFEVKLKLLRAELESERHRVAEVRKVLAESQKSVACLQAELDSTKKDNELLRKDASAKSKTATKSREALVEVRKELAQTRDELVMREKEVADSKRSEKLAVMREQEKKNLLKQMEQQLRDQEQRSREEIRRLEAEFDSTTDDYQKLIKEAAEKLAVLEKVEKKYRSLKEEHREQKHHQDEVSSGVLLLREEKKQLEEQVEKLQTESESLHLQLARKEHELREERAEHNQVVDGIMKRLEQQEEKTSQEHDELQKCVRHSEERIVRLQRAIEGLEQQLKEEQAHSKELLLKLEESSQRHQEELAAARRSASSYQQQSEGITLSLKRQLREKNAKLEALAKTASEPIQRLRTQLEDERSKRAKLEEQFTRYKERAKAAEQAALRVIRHEQQRFSPSLRPRTAARTHHCSSAQVEEKITALPPPLASTTATNVPSSSCSAHMVGSSSTTPVSQGCPLAAAHDVLPSATPSKEEPKQSTPPELRSATPAVVCDSVGSISNISFSSPLCSTHAGDAKSGDVSNTSVGGRGCPAPLAMRDIPCSPVEESLNDRVVRHEQLLRDFHQSAAEVFKKITGNREEFLAKCTSVVRSASHHALDSNGIYTPVVPQEHVSD
ncbi:hypothetical protein TRVL_03254 [Trypanosoma vivax]|nr:hypothetical protein TRVL_03254 [Trypanosoma vivax]